MKTDKIWPKTFKFYGLTLLLGSLMWLLKTNGLAVEDISFEEFGSLLVVLPLMWGVSGLLCLPLLFLTALYFYAVKRWDTTGDLGTRLALTASFGFVISGAWGLLLGITMFGELGLWPYVVSATMAGVVVEIT